MKAVKKARPAHRKRGCRKIIKLDDGVAPLLHLSKKTEETPFCFVDFFRFLRTLIKQFFLNLFYAGACTGNRCFPVRLFCILAWSLLRLYPILSKRISSFTLVFPRSRNL